LAHNNARYALNNSSLTPTKSDSHLVELKNLSFNEIIQYDRRYFPALRSKFLSAWINQNTALALGYIKENQLQGYGLIRKCFEGYKIGPLFADSSLIAEKLFESLVDYAQGDSVYLDIPENNPLAVDLVNKYGMIKVFATARMYLKGAPRLPIEGIFGITTFELG
jgi:hypothetical protein